jgi:hypothetical protein
MPPERTTQSYGPGVTSASRAVLLELWTTLRAYREALVLVGGWVPYFLLSRHQRAEDRFVHVGSIDIDLVVDPARVEEPEYATIVELLRERGYAAAPDRRGEAIPGSLLRTVPSPTTRKPYTIRVDFLTPPHTDGSRHHRPVQDDLLARKVRGCEAALRYYTAVTLSGALPDGGELSVSMRMADLTAILAMKGIVLGERYREKDAYDLYALLAHYGRGPAEAAEAVRRHRNDPLVAEGVAGIQAAFARRESNGPVWAATFLTSPQFATEHQRLITDAFMVVSEFLRLVDPSTQASVSPGALARDVAHHESRDRPERGEAESKATTWSPRGTPGAPQPGRPDGAGRFHAN